jgi:hypothetical protein
MDSEFATEYGQGPPGGTAMPAPPIVWLVKVRLPTPQSAWSTSTLNPEVPWLVSRTSELALTAPGLGLLTAISTADTPPG